MKVPQAHDQGITPCEGAVERFDNGRDQGGRRRFSCADRGNVPLFHKRCQHRQRPAVERCQGRRRVVALKGAQELCRGGIEFHLAPRIVFEQPREKPVAEILDEQQFLVRRGCQDARSGEAPRIDPAGKRRKPPAAAGRIARRIHQDRGFAAALDEAGEAPRRRIAGDRLHPGIVPAGRAKECGDRVRVRHRRRFPQRLPAASRPGASEGLSRRSSPPAPRRRRWEQG